MPERSIHDILRETFQHTSKEAWNSIASQELSDNKDLATLIWKVGDLAFHPYYDHTDLADTAYLKKFHSVTSQANQPPQYWTNMPKISVLNAASANELALHYLSGGADGILFDVTIASDLNPGQLLDKINLSICDVSFITNNNASLAKELLAYAKKNGHDPVDLQGSIYYTSRVEKKDVVIPDFNLYRTLGIIVKPASPVEEISMALFEAVRYLDFFSDMGLKKEQLIKMISMSFTAEENFFLTIAKLKAVRLLWYQVSQAFNINNFSPEDLHIHLFAAPWNDEKFDPHGNMLKNTFQAIAGVLGGTNALTLSATDEDNEMLNRAALNISNILKEEAHIDNVADPLAGAYAIDNMVNSLAKAAWQSFQNKMHA